MRAVPTRLEKLRGELNRRLNDFEILVGNHFLTNEQTDEFVRRETVLLDEIYRLEGRQK